MERSNDLAAYRLEQAEQCLKSAKLLIAAEDYKGATNRSYYCIFHAMRSVMALENTDFKSHSAVISYFRKKYIKTMIFDKKMSDIIGELFMIRNESDYDDFIILSKEKTAVQIESAEYFFNAVQKYFMML
jgi:uncharacterized protein (UPF0332 family)